MATLHELIERYGKDKVNTLTKYPSIQTLHKVGDKGRLSSELSVPNAPHQWIATEKIDGTNARILVMRGQWVIGSRENLLCSNGDLFFDPAQGIVEGLTKLLDLGVIADEYVLNLPPDEPGGSITMPMLTVIYGEFYGGKVTAGSRNYGTDQVGFRVFDVARFPDAEKILSMDRASISAWRETETPEGIVYGQRFLEYADQESFARNMGLEVAPLIHHFYPVSFAHEDVLHAMRCALPLSKAALTDKALGRPEGLVLRTRGRWRIVKVRFEDYERVVKR